MFSTRDLVGAKDHRYERQRNRREDNRPAKKSARISNMRGGIFSRISQAVERSRRFIDGRHQMRGDIHQIHRDPFRRKFARRRTSGAGESFFVDQSSLVILGLPFRGRDAM